MRERFVLCRPQGGLNDILNQIELCCRYGQRHGRIVIVDTNHRHAPSFRSAFSNYFVSRSPWLVLDNPFSDQDLDAMEVFPAQLRGRLSSYETGFAPPSSRVDLDSGVVISFDFGKDYPHRMLVHDSAGGGERSLVALLRLRLHDRLLDALVNRLTALPRDYCALHIRNTDMKSNYRGTLAEMRKRQLRDLFLATDSAEVMQHARATLTGTTIHSFVTLPEGGQPLHDKPDVRVADQRNCDAILDLLTLALSPTLFITPVVNRTGQFSGFSRLARNLNGNRPVLLNLLERNDIHAIVRIA